jgi:hypothetical protein
LERPREFFISKSPDPVTLPAWRFGGIRGPAPKLPGC